MARDAARRWQGWATNARTNAEVEAISASRLRAHTAQAAKRRAELGRAAAPLIVKTMPPHTGWVTLDDVCAFAGIEREEADAGCEVLEQSGDVERRTVLIESGRKPVQAVRRSTAGTLDSEPLRLWLKRVIAQRFDDDVAEAAICLETHEAFLRRVLDGDCSRVLLEAADWLFVRAGDPHQLQLLYPTEDASLDAMDTATA